MARTATARRPSNKTAADKAETKRINAVRKAHYEGGHRIIIGGVPCKVAHKSKSSWYRPSDCLGKMSVEEVRARENRYAYMMLERHGIDFDRQGDATAAFRKAYPGIRAERGDIIPDFSDNAMDVDMFTGEISEPQGFRDPVESEPDNVADPVENVADTTESRQDDAGLWIVNMGERPVRKSRTPQPLDMTRYHSTRPATLRKRQPTNVVCIVTGEALDAYGCEIMRNCVPDMRKCAEDVRKCAADELWSVADLRAYWQEQSLTTFGYADAGWMDAMHDTWMQSSAQDIATALEKAARAPDRAAWLMVSSYGALLASQGARMAA